MRKELQDQLFSDFPKLYRQKDLSMQETCMCWGICVGEGWHDIVRELSEKLEPLGVEAAQVKEKFGGLRFYIDHGEATKEQFLKAQELINVAESKSYKTCEECGKAGSTGNRKNTWIRTLCGSCRRKREESRYVPTTGSGNGTIYDLMLGTPTDEEDV